MEPLIIQKRGVRRNASKYATWLLAGVVGVALLLVLAERGGPHIIGSTSNRRRAAKKIEYKHEASGGDTLRTNSYLQPGDSLVSNNGMYHANLSRNGVFRIYKHDSYAGERVIYELGKPPDVQTQFGYSPGKRANGDYYAMLKNDGTLVIQKGVDPKHRAFTIDTASPAQKQEIGEFRAVMQDDGCFIIYNSTQDAAWWSNQATLSVRGYIEQGDVLVSPRGAHFAVLESDALATYEGFGPFDPKKKKTFEWKIRKSRLSTRKGARLFANLLENGDFEIVSALEPEDKLKKIMYRSRTGGFKRGVDTYFMFMQDDGELVLYGGRGPDIGQYNRVWGTYEACLNPIEVTLSGAMRYLPLMGPLYKELSALAYWFKPWCSHMAKARAIDGLKSLGMTMGVTVLPMGLRLMQTVSKDGWKGVLRVKDENALPDHYEALGISRDASIDEIKLAYKQVSIENHPDKCKSGEDQSTREEKFKKYSNAYNILADENQRDKYDATLPLFDFRGVTHFFGTLGASVKTCLGIREEMRVDYGPAVNAVDFSEDLSTGGGGGGSGAMGGGQIEDAGDGLE